MELKRKDYHFDTVLARYLTDEETGAVSLTLLPSDRQEDAYDRRQPWLEVPHRDPLPGHLQTPRQPRQGPPRCGDRPQFAVTGFLSQRVEIGKSRCTIGSCNGFLG